MPKSKLQAAGFAVLVPKGVDDQKTPDGGAWKEDVPRPQAKGNQWRKIGWEASHRFSVPAAAARVHLDRNPYRVAR